jgi:hypothetical protein
MPAHWGGHLTLSDDLLCVYNLQDNAGSTYVTDATARTSGTASTNTSTLYSALGVLTGGSFDFRDGASNDSVAIAGLEAVVGQYLDYGKPFSFACWVNPDAVTAGAYRHLLANKAYSANCCNMGIKGAGLDWYWRNASAFNVSKTADVLAAGQWSHVAYVYDGAGSPKYDAGHIKIYHNGASKALSSDADSGTVAASCANTATWYIAMPPADTSFDLDGKMQQVAIWSRALTAAEVTSLYNGGSGLAY